MTNALPDISTLLDIMRRLRDPQSGCPWDIEQSFATIAPYTIEEAYEVAGAIEDADWPGLKDELGDPLWDLVHLPPGIETLLPGALTRHLSAVRVAFAEKIFDSETIHRK